MHPTQEREQSTCGGVAAAVRPIRVTVVLSIFAEKQTVPEIVEGLFEGCGEAIEEMILLVADRAPPETLAICAETAKRFPRTRVSMQTRNPGLGLAVRQGIEEALGTHILLMDSDGEMDVETVPLMLRALEQEQLDMVVASRWIRGGGVEGYDRFKYFLNRGYQSIFRLLYRTPIHDLTLGFKLGRADVMKALPWSSQFHDIGCETTLRVVRAGWKVGEVPTVWRKRKEGATSNPFRRNFKYVSMALAILFGPSHRTGPREPNKAS